jgi:hypothetical protein
MLEYYFALTSLIALYQLVQYWAGSNSLEESISITTLWPLYVVKILLKSIISLLRDDW